MVILAPFTEKPKEPRAITFYPSENFEDDKSSLRWRASWNKHFDGSILGVDVRCYPVVRETPCGAWIDQHAYREWRDGGWDWSQPYHDLLKWVSNDGGAAWAKPTKQEALYSLVYRHKRWSSRILNDICYFMEASEALAELFPESKEQADYGLRSLLYTARTGKR